MQIKLSQEAYESEHGSTPVSCHREELDQIREMLANRNPVRCPSCGPGVARLAAL
jgi:hypothetical protein